MSKRLVASVAVVLAVVVASGCATPPGVVSRTFPGDLVQVTVVRVEIDAEEGLQKVFLQEKDSRRSLPVYIGLAEAQAIKAALTGGEFPRPRTHDLTANLIGALGGTLQRVVIELQDNTFIATLLIKHGLATTQMDSRASDALALALRTKAPVFVPDELLGRTSVELAPGPGAP